MSELKACPFCGESKKIVYDYYEISSPQELGTIVVCNNCGASCNPDDWNIRPIEDALLARAEQAEAIIRGMFPLWIAAMSYAEHGRAADLDRIRNYYNGRDNPLTSDQLHYLFSMENKE